jgi:uncharacterized RDD family membrane protein YckC
VANPTKVVWWRVLAWFIDLIPTAVLYAVGLFQFLVEVPDGSRPPQDAVKFFEGDTSTYYLPDSDALKIYLWAVVFILINGIVVQGLTGGTIGKLCTGLCVVREDGRPAGLVKCLIRTIVLFIDNILFLGLILILATKGNRRLGDMAAGTYVVKRSSAGRPVVLDAPAGFGYGQPPHYQPGYGGPAQPGYGQAGGYGQPTPWVPGQQAAAQPAVEWEKQPEHQPQAQPVHQTEHQPQAQTAPPGEPQWDPARQAWIRWDGTAWTQHDPQTNAWGPIR